MTRPIIPTSFDDAYMPEPNSGCWLWLARMLDRLSIAALLRADALVARMENRDEPRLPF